MTVTIEKLEKLERKVALSFPLESVRQEVQARLKDLARRVKMDGFRPGKVPMNVVNQRYGYSVHMDVINDKVGQAFGSAVRDAQLRVAGAPRISEKAQAVEGELAFDAVFEVYPEVQMSDLSQIQVEKIHTEVSEAAIDKTVEILRKQRRTFAQRALDVVAQDGDRVTVDFEGKIDGEPFEGGRAQDFAFMLGEGQMLKEFEEAVRGMKVGESRTFPLDFPADYHGKEVAGKQADFLVTLKKLEGTHLPEVNDAFAQSLGIADATMQGLRRDIHKNLEHELKQRLNARNKAAVMEALLSAAELELPKASVQAEVDRMIEEARANLKERGIKDADKAPIPDDVFRPQAERRTRLGLTVAHLVQANQLQATEEQIKKHVQELAASYEQPSRVEAWYREDPQRLAGVEAVVIENNVMDFVLSKAQVKIQEVSFDELMGQ